MRHAREPASRCIRLFKKRVVTMSIFKSGRFKRAKLDDPPIARQLGQTGIDPLRDSVVAFVPEAVSNNLWSGGWAGAFRFHVSKRSRRGQPLNLPPGPGDVARQHPPPPLLRQIHKRHVADLVDEPRHAVSHREDGVVATAFEDSLPLHTGRLHLRAHVENRFCVVERLQIEPRPDALREALHPCGGENLLQLCRSTEHNMHRRQRCGDIGQQTQLFNQPGGEGGGLVHQHHQPRSGGGQTADAFHHADPQFPLLDPAVRLTDSREDRLPQRAAGADPGA